jgi:spore germination cell wall hydrolase CwlJ-like protein
MNKTVILKELAQLIKTTEKLIDFVEALPDGTQYVDDKEIDFMARTIWGEARNQGEKGMEAVGHVIKNRAESDFFPNTIEKVVTQPWQFSVWNQGNVNLDKMLNVTEDDPEFAKAKDIAKKIIMGMKPDITRNADHYHEKQIDPYWAVGNNVTVRLGDHVFYRLM